MINGAVNVSWMYDVTIIHNKSLFLTEKNMARMDCAILSKELVTKTIIKCRKCITRIQKLFDKNTAIWNCTVTESITFAFGFILVKDDDDDDDADTIMKF